MWGLTGLAGGCMREVGSLWSLALNIRGLMERAEGTVRMKSLAGQTRGHSGEPNPAPWPWMRTHGFPLHHSSDSTWPGATASIHHFPGHMQPPAPCQALSIPDSP